MFMVSSPNILKYLHFYKRSYLLLLQEVPMVIHEMEQRSIPSFITSQHTEDEEQVSLSEIAVPFQDCNIQESIYFVLIYRTTCQGF